MVAGGWWLAGGSRSAGASARWGASVSPEARDSGTAAPQQEQQQQGGQGGPGQAQGLQERRAYTIPAAFQSEVFQVLTAQQQLLQLQSGAGTPTLTQDYSGVAGSRPPTGGGGRGVGGGGCRRGPGAGSPRSAEPPGPIFDAYANRTADPEQRPVSGVAFHPVDVSHLGLGLDLGLVADVHGSAAAVRTAPAGAAAAASTLASPASSGMLGLLPYGPPASVLTVRELDGSSSLRSHMGVLVGSLMSTLRQSAESCDTAGRGSRPLGG